jgi:hypothetical protein
MPISFPPALPLASNLPSAPEEPSWPAPGAVEAIRVGGDVYLRQPELPWPGLSVAQRREGARVRLEVRVVVRAGTPSLNSWVEVLADGGWEGRWEARGSVESLRGDGAIGWLKSLTLEPDGTAIESGYPPIACTRRWRVDPSGGRAELEGSYGPIPITALARRAMTYPPLGPLRDAELTVQAIPADGSTGPRPALRARTDHEGVAWVEVSEGLASLWVGHGDLPGCQIKL